MPNSKDPRRRRLRTGAIHIPSLMIGLGLSLVLATAFALVAGTALRTKEPGEFDLRWALRFKANADAHPDNTAWINAVTYLGNRYVLAAVAVAGALWQAWRGRRWLAIGWVIVTVGGYGLNEAVKSATARDRPALVLRDRAVTEHLSSWSFPSGHAMGAMIGFGLVGYAMVLSARNRLQVTLPVVDVAVIVAAVGFSRVYLRVHWATDVIAGFLLGGAWLALSLGILEGWRRANVPEQPAAGTAKADAPVAQPVPAQPGGPA